jgi:hypothetical protein
MTRSKLQRNLNPSGRLSNMAFGFYQFADGLIRMLSLGFAHTTLPLDHARRTAKARFDKLKRAQK